MNTPYACSDRCFKIVAVSVILVFTVVFVQLRERHSAQVRAASQSIYVFSPLESNTRKFAEYISTRAPVRIWSIADDRTASRLRSIGVDPEIVTPALILPHGDGRAIVSNQKVIQEILSPLSGGATQALRGSVTALAALGIWLLFWVWWRKVAYLGAAWPALGALALSLTVPNCPECLGSPKLAWIPWVGLAGFCAALVVFGTAGSRPRWAIVAAATIAGGAALLQSYALLSEPKLCPFCILAAAAAAGLFFVCRTALADHSPRFVSGTRALSVACIALACMAAGGQFWSKSAQAKELKDFHSAIGRSISEFARGFELKRNRQLVLVTLAGCDACDQAQADLTQAKVPFQEIPYNTVLSTGPTFKADFSRVAPLILICDATGKILQAEAGWSADPEEKSQLLESCKRSLGGDDVP
jgi:hypothetical protein